MSAPANAVPTDDNNEAAPDKPTFGQRISDWVAKTMGSWKFVIGQAIFIAGWIALNTIIPIPPFDPSLILLNLGLSTEAAFAGAFILMSQNRQAEKDRETVQNDYHVDIKSEKTIEVLNKKLDILMAALPPEQLKAAANSVFAKQQPTNDNAPAPVVAAPAVKLVR